MWHDEEAQSSDDETLKCLIENHQSFKESLVKERQNSRNKWLYKVEKRHEYRFHCSVHDGWKNSCRSSNLCGDDFLIEIWEKTTSKKACKNSRCLQFWAPGVGWLLAALSSSDNTGNDGSMIILKWTKVYQNMTFSVFTNLGIIDYVGLKITFWGTLG